MPTTTLALALTYTHQRWATHHITARTAGQTRYTLTDFARHAPADPAQIRRRHVEQWLAGNPDHSPAYLRARLSTVRCYSRWLVAHRHVAVDFTAGVEPPKVPALTPRALTGVEAGRLVDSCHDLRTRLIVLLMLQEGLRRAEVAAIDVADIDWTARTLSVRGKGGQGRVNGVVPISEQTWRTLSSWVAAGRLRHGPLLRSRRDGGALSPSRVGELVREQMIAAEVKVFAGDGRSGHALRHTAAHDLLGQTADVYAVKRALRR